MPVQVWVGKGFDSQKALRFFQERRVSVQRLEVLKKPPSKGELTSVIQKLGIAAVIDTKSRAFLSSSIRFSNRDDLKLDALLENPSLLKLPIVRYEKNCTVGYTPEIWQTWPLPTK